MPLKALVKVGSLTNLSDARYCAGMGVDMIGFSVIEGQPAYLEPSKFHEIRGWITGPSIVAQLHGLANAGQIATILENYKPDYFELGLPELAIAGELSLPFILVIKENEAIPSLNIKPAYLLLRNPVATEGIKILVAVDGRDKVAEILELPDVVGIAMNGSSEISPGLKNYDELADILEQLEDD